MPTSKDQKEEICYLVMSVGLKLFTKNKKKKTNSLGFLKSIIWVTHPFEYCENDVFAQSLGNRS